jgi:hypothetical protein
MIASPRAQFKLLHMTMRSRTLLALQIGSVVSLLVIGCATHPHPSTAPSTQMATDIDPATTQPDYWYDQPGVASVEWDNFYKLWHTSEDVARSYLFRIDRVDYRDGILTTEPLVSAQWWEPWRRDVQTIDDAMESSLSTMRRTIRFEFTRLPSGLYRVTPKVLVERRSVAEHRITSVALYRYTFRPQRGSVHNMPYGTPETDVGIILPARYWYPVGRDEALERAIADRIAKRLKPSEKK